MLSVLRASSLDRFCLVTLHDFLVRTNQLHTCFFAGGINHGLHYIFSARRIIDNGSHYMLGHAKGRVRPATRRRRPQKQQHLRASFSHFSGLGFGGQQLEEVLPKVRQDVEALKEMPTPCCMCEPLVTAQCLGDETHAVVTRPQWAGEHGQHTW